VGIVPLPGTTRWTSAEAASIRARRRKLCETTPATQQQPPVFFEARVAVDHAAIPRLLAAKAAQRTSLLYIHHLRSSASGGVCLLSRIAAAAAPSVLLRADGSIDYVHPSTTRSDVAAADARPTPGGVLSDPALSGGGGGGGSGDAATGGDAAAASSPFDVAVIAADKAVKSIAIASSTPTSLTMAVELDWSVYYSPSRFQVEGSLPSLSLTMTSAHTTTFPDGKFGAAQRRHISQRLTSSSSLSSSADVYYDAFNGGDADASTEAVAALRLTRRPVTPGISRYWFDVTVACDTVRQLNFLQAFVLAPMLTKTVLLPSVTVPSAAFDARFDASSLLSSSSSPSSSSSSHWRVHRAGWLSYFLRFSTTSSSTTSAASDIAIGVAVAVDTIPALLLHPSVATTAFADGTLAANIDTRFGGALFNGIRDSFASGVAGVLGGTDVSAVREIPPPSAASLPLRNKWLLPPGAAWFMRWRVDPVIVGATLHCACTQSSSSSSSSSASLAGVWRGAAAMGEWRWTKREEGSGVATLLQSNELDTRLTFLNDAGNDGGSSAATSASECSANVNAGARHPATRPCAARLLSQLWYPDNATSTTSTSTSSSSSAEQAPYLLAFSIRSGSAKEGVPRVPLADAFAFSVPFSLPAWASWPQTTAFTPLLRPQPPARESTSGGGDASGDAVDVMFHVGDFALTLRSRRQ
jgi:hypothetical protein